MGWFAAVDAYCERLGPGFGAEPLNMLTGLAFLIVGLWAFRQAPGRADQGAALALALVGIASAVQHALALSITLWADIAANLTYFVLLGVLLLRRLAGVGAVAALAGSVAVVGLAQVLGSSAVLSARFGVATDSFFLLFLILLACALVLRRAHPFTSRGLALAALVLAAGLPFRFLDALLCAVWPTGTHWLWHLFNAGSAALVLATLARHGRGGLREAGG